MTAGMAFLAAAVGTSAHPKPSKLNRSNVDHRPTSENKDPTSNEDLSGEASARHFSSDRPTGEEQLDIRIKEAKTHGEDDNVYGMQMRIYNMINASHERLVRAETNRFITSEVGSHSKQSKLAKIMRSVRKAIHHMTVKYAEWGERNRW